MLIISAAHANDAVWPHFGRSLKKGHIGALSREAGLLILASSLNEFQGFPSLDGTNYPGNTPKTPASWQLGISPMRDLF